MREESDALITADWLDRRAVVSWRPTIAQRGSRPARAPRNVAEFDELFRQVSNWGRWGKDDQLGSANLVTDAKRKQAAGLVKNGVSVSLAHNAITEKAVDNPSPFEHTMNPGFFMDTYKVSYHGYAHSHIDALCHILYKDQTYNGYARAEVNTEKGCTKLGIDNLKSGVVTRGILIDIPRLRNLPYLEPGTAIYVEDLEAWEKKAGVKVSSGDAVLVRTGRWARREKLGPWNVAQSAAGRARVGGAVVQGARRRVRRQRRGARRHPVARRRQQPARAHALHHRDGHSSAGQSGPRSRERDGREVEPLGVHADDCARAGDRRYGIPAQRARDVLTGRRTRAR